MKNHIVAADWRRRSPGMGVGVGVATVVVVVRPKSTPFTVVSDPFGTPPSIGVVVPKE